ncbi:unnamed protein product [Timema podura]|uniref:Uncharacterized protein n=1 Tax=Timema podura TaxID=61482 RepID=A0ABN7PED0_TIMPD|nr:unnamed protein product [Timema podura]
MYNEPEIYSVNTIGVLRNLFPNLMAAANNTRVQSAPWFRQAQINSLQGTKFSSFAKASHFHKDLYADWVAATLETDLVVESWTNGVGPLPSECSKQFKWQRLGGKDVCSHGTRLRTFHPRIQNIEYVWTAGAAEL